MNPDTPELDPCGCCAAEVLKQPDRFNRPGLPALAYRIGTHPGFLQRMLARLPTQAIPDGPNKGARPLAKLTTRAADDPAIALLDAWASVADVLTFYQERIANEGFLRTATERRSVLELARTIGYELNPGVAASTFLAFTVEDAPGAPGVATVPLATPVLSIPGQGQLPQTFETIEAIEARVEWNALRPELTVPQTIARGTKELYLKGVTTELKPGDGILLVGEEREEDPGSERWDFRILKTVTPSTDGSYTHVTWEEGLKHEAPATAPAKEHVRFFAMRQRAALFGHNAPDPRMFNTSGTGIGNLLTADREDWKDFQIRNAQIDLGAVYPNIVAGSWVVLTSAALPAKPGLQLYQAQRVSFSSRADFGLSAQFTRIAPDTTEHLSLFGLRQTTAFVHSEPLELADKPLADPVQGKEIDLDRLVQGLVPGRTLILSGKPHLAEKEDPTVNEVAFIEAVAAEGERTRITLSKPLEHSYERTTVTINANIARATHGETVKNEVLGSGDGAKPNQRFALKRPPLTYISAPTASGARSTLELRVDGVLWQEVPSLFGLDNRSQGYIVRIDDDGKTRVVCGDGEQGARLPTRTENVVATYRSGIGLAGNVAADKLTLLQTRPLGVRGMTNLLAASGGADPEALEEARTNAPLAVLTLERIVSLKDFEDFARAFAGIGKAKAQTLWTGEQRLIHITVAAANGDEVSPTSELYINLVKAIDAERDPGQRVEVASFKLRTFSLEASVLVDPRYVPAEVLAEVKDALLEDFAFERRDFGQPMTAAEVVTAMQAVKGVVAVDLDLLTLEDSPAGAPQPTVVLPAKVARRAGELTELLLIHPEGIRLKQMIS